MEKKPKTIIDAEKKVLDRQGEGSALRESQRVMSTPEFLFLHDLEKRGFQPSEKNHLDVWFVQHNRREGGMKLEDIQKLNEFAYMHNEAVKANEGKTEEREYRFKTHFDSGDMRYYLEQTYERPEMIREIPEVIVITATKGESNSDWSGIPAMIQKSIEKCLDRLNWYWDEKIIMHLGENLCCSIGNKFDYEKLEISEDSLIEYGLYNLESIQRERQRELFEKYIFSKNEKYLSEFFSDESLKEMYDWMCEVPVDSIQGFLWEFEDTDDVESNFYEQFKGVVNHEQKKKEFDAEWDEEVRTGQIEEAERPNYEENQHDYEEMNAAVENYWKYRESIAEFFRRTSFDGIKEKMRQVYIAEVKKVLDDYAEEYVHEFEIFEAEKKILKPVLVFVGENPVQRELMRDHGADLVLEKFSSDNIKDLLEMAAKMKASSASLVPQKLRRIKTEFYQSVEDKLDSRSEITAETEKEIEILHEIFQKNGGVKKVLDVACGNGRIDIPLLQMGYEVTGIDANENFLQSALRKSFERGLTKGRFKRGDVIDYKGVVERESQDAVVYTWHSILEAFGIGNLLQTLGNARDSLRAGGVLVFDQPTRENQHMENGWYGNDPDGEHHYLSYIMTEKEIEFILKMAGFENVEIKKWTTRPSDEYPDGMHKFTVSARKPEMSEKDAGLTSMYRGMIAGDPEYKKMDEEWSKDLRKWMDDFEKRKKKSA